MMAATLEEFLRHYTAEGFTTKEECLRFKGLFDKENKWRFKEPFPHPFHWGFYGEGASPRTLAELRMIRLSVSIRSEQGWERKMQDPSAVAKWKEDADKLGLTEAQFKFVIAELDFYASLKCGPMEPSVVDGVWQADGLVSEDLRQSLIREVARLENIPESQKNWKPGSGQLVLNVLDPSLFCLVYGVTKQVQGSRVPSTDLVGGGEVIPPPIIHYEPCEEKPYVKSEKYQWLPAEFCVSDTGEVEIKSYINNLHPKWHATMYRLWEKIFREITPLLAKPLAFIIDGYPLRIDVNPLKWYTDPPDRPEYDSNGKEIDYLMYEGCELILPDAPEFETPENPPYESVDFSGRNLQVIVELENIFLTPDNPIYPGESWHIHGMENEQIIASVVYYYHSENMRESKMHFRQGIREPVTQEFDYEGVRQVYGLVDGDPLNQYLGAVVIRDNRCIAFPNVCQFRMDSLQLEDEMKPGYCKMLSFFLVDPAVRVLSTANVPPQQKSWYIDHLREIEPFNRLPLEILQKIVSYLQWPMSLEDAKLYRDKLEEERKDFTATHTKDYFERPYSPR